MATPHEKALKGSDKVNLAFTRHAKHLNDQELSNGLKKYFAQRKRRRN